jgi:uncharacterized membrane protein YphA (DoxX/SURF4 family)
MKQKWTIFLLLCFSLKTFCHEKWFFSQNEINMINQHPTPIIFTQIGFFNTIVIFIATSLLLLWVLLAKSPALPKNYLMRTKHSSSILRISTGVMLLLLSIGLMPRFSISFLTPALFAPDLIIPIYWSWLKWIGILLSIFLITGLLTRFITMMWIIILLFCIYLFGEDILQYFGFYLGIFLFLFLNSGNKKPSLIKNKYSIVILQILTGLNFIYSAITIKFFQPNLDIILLEKTNAYTLGLPYDYFNFIMCTVEVMIGILFIIGASLDILAVFLIFLFTLLSLNLSENIILHLFLYGILASFIFLKGVNILKLKNYT